jgi:hypothetical protein
MLHKPTCHSNYQSNIGSTLSVWGTGIPLNTFCNLAKEFWLDLRRKIHNRRHPE